MPTPPVLNGRDVKWVGAIFLSLQTRVFFSTAWRYYWCHFYYDHGGIRMGGWWCFYLYAPHSPYAFIHSNTPLPLIHPQFFAYSKPIMNSSHSPPSPSAPSSPPSSPTPSTMALKLVPSSACNTHPFLSLSWVLEKKGWPNRAYRSRKETLEGNWIRERKEYQKLEIEARRIIILLGY